MKNLPIIRERRGKNMLGQRVSAEGPVEEFILFYRSSSGAHDVNAFPKVSIFWLNYNSIGFKDIVLRSLESVCMLKYPNLELIAVDNGSKDGSYEIIKDFLGKADINAKLVRLKKNLGFTGGNNVAYRLMDPNAKYFVLLNNDAIAYPESLSKLVGLMEADALLAAAQGVILNYYSGLVDSAGGFVDMMLRAHMAYQGLPRTLVKNPLSVSYADGAFSIYRVSAVKHALGCDDKIFDNITLAYYDDTFLGLKLWNKGYKVKSFPFVAAKHIRGFTSKKLRPMYAYLVTRNWIALVLSSNTKFKPLVAILVLKSLIVRSIRHIGSPELIKDYVMAVSSGVKIGWTKRSRGEGVDVYRAKILYLPPKQLILGLISRRFSLKSVRVY